MDERKDKEDCPISNEKTYDDLYSQFMERLEEAHARYKHFISGMDAQDILGMADVIAAKVNTYDYLRNDHHYDRETLEYLLNFHDPIEVVSDVYLDNLIDVDITEEMRDVMYTVMEKQNGLYGGYELESTRPDAPNSPPVQESINHAPGLPKRCFAFMESKSCIVEVYRGKDGVIETGFGTGIESNDVSLTDFYNQRNGVTPAQREAMLFGASLGKWDAPGADPRNYREDGTPRPPSEWIIPPKSKVHAQKPQKHER